MLRIEKKLIVAVFLVLLFVLSPSYKENKAEAVCADRVLILMDGYNSNSEGVKKTFLDIKVALRDIGYSREPIEFSYRYPQLTYTADDTYDAFPASVDSLHKTVSDLILSCPNVQIDLIGYSLGGLVAFEYLSQYAQLDEAGHIKHLITLDSPVLGTSQETLLLLSYLNGWEKLGESKTGIFLRSRNQNINLTQLSTSALSMEGKTIIRNIVSTADEIVLEKVAGIRSLKRAFDLGKDLKSCLEKNWVPCFGHSQVLTSQLVMNEIRQILTTEPGQAGWYTFHRDNARTGRTEAIGPSTPFVRWVFYGFSDEFSTAVPCCFGAGELIVPTADILYSAGSCVSGNQLYKITAKDGQLSSVGRSCAYEPAVAPNGDIYSVDQYRNSVNRHEFSFSKVGSSNWSIRSTIEGSFSGSPIVDSFGFGYTYRHDEVFAFSPSGEISWRLTFTDSVWVGLSGSLAMSKDGSFYAYGYTGTFLPGEGVSTWHPVLNAVNRGGVKWRFPSNAAKFKECKGFLNQFNNNYSTYGPHSAPSVDANGRVYFAPCDGLLYSVNPDGTLAWSFGPGKFLVGVPSIDIDNSVYIGSLDGYLYAVDSSGKEKWNYYVGRRDQNSSPKVSLAPVLRVSIDGAGNVYFLGPDGAIYSLTSSGSLRWKISTGFATYADTEGGVAIGPDGNLYVKLGSIFTLRPIVSIGNTDKISYQYSPVTTTVASFPRKQGRLLIPPASSGISLNVMTQSIPTPDSLPTSTIAVRTVDIVLSNKNTDEAVKKLEKEATIEFSYGDLGLTDDLISRLVIYHHGPNRFLNVNFDRERKVVSARTKTFSSFTLAFGIKPTSRVHLPLVSN